MSNLKGFPRSILSILPWLTSSAVLCGICSATPSITLSEKTGPPTSHILVSGRGFEPNVGVDIYFDTKDERLVLTDGKGEFHDARVYAPRGARPGQHWVTALERNNDKGAQRPFVVETDWTEGRFDPANSGFNSYENVLDRKSVGNLGLKWISNGGDTTPTIADGVVYSADTYGYVYAINAKNGLVLWTYQDNCGSVFSPPAVVDGVVYFGGYCEIHALDAKTGAVIWTQPDGHGTFALTVVGGAVYFGNYGYAYKLDAKNGSPLWSYDTGNYSILSAPAVVDGVVYVSSGDLVALDARTGKLIWSYPIGNGYDVWAGPSVDNGVVYVGSGDNNIYALNANNGSLLWSYTTGGAIYDDLAVANGIVYCPSADGNLYALDAYSGILLWKYASPSLYPTSSAIANGVLYVAMTYNCVSSIVALDANSGDPLWEYAGSCLWEPSVADGTVYTGDYAFGLTHGGEAKQEAASERPVQAKLRPDFALKVSSQAGR